MSDKETQGTGPRSHAHGRQPAISSSWMVDLFTRRRWLMMIAALKIHLHSRRTNVSD